MNNVIDTKHASEIVNFILDNYTRANTLPSLAKEVNEKFGTNFNQRELSKFMKENNIIHTIDHDGHSIRVIIRVNDKIKNEMDKSCNNK